MKRFGSVLLTVGFVTGAADAHVPASCVALLSEILTLSTDEEAAVIALLLVAEEHALAPSRAGQEQYSELAAAVGRMLKAYAEMNSKEAEFLSCIHSDGWQWERPDSNEHPRVSSMAQFRVVARTVHETGCVLTGPGGCPYRGGMSEVPEDHQLARPLDGLAVVVLCVLIRLPG